MQAQHFEIGQHGQKHIENLEVGYFKHFRNFARVCARGRTRTRAYLHIIIKHDRIYHHTKFGSKTTFR